MARNEFSIVIDVTTTNGHLTVDILPYEEGTPMGHDETLALTKSDAIKSAIFDILRQLQFTGS